MWIHSAMNMQVLKDTKFYPPLQPEQYILVIINCDPCKQSIKYAPRKITTGMMSHFNRYIKGWKSYVFPPCGSKTHLVPPFSASLTRFTHQHLSLILMSCQH